jgi:predicted nucleotidyltransferase
VGEVRTKPDIGVFVSNWDQFTALKNELVNSGQFKPVKQTQRLFYKDNGPVDIVPLALIIVSANKSLSLSGSLSESIWRDR